jgi:ribosomal protein L15
MIHFNFTVSNEDAENIFTILNNQIVHNHEKMVKLVANGSLEYNMLEAYKRDNKYIKELIKKMTNTKVEE